MILDSFEFDIGPAHWAAFGVIGTAVITTIGRLLVKSVEVKDGHHLQRFDHIASSVDILLEHYQEDNERLREELVAERARRTPNTTLPKD